MNILAALFGNLQFWGKTAVVTAIIAALGTAYVYWHHEVYQSGYSAAIDKIAAQDQEAVNAANAARLRIHECNFADGMRWDVETGKCVAR